MFTGIGTVVNVLAILVGGGIGYVIKGGLKPHYQDAIMKILGVCTLFIGATGALPGMMQVQGGSLASGDTLGLILSLVIGVLIGEFLDFEGKLERLGEWLRAKASRGEDNKFVEGFVTTSLVVCIGAMAIVGAMQDALSHDPSTLFTKSILDFMMVMICTSTYGKGALFSALPVGVLQGGVTICASLLAPVFSAQVIASLSHLGSVMIFCLGCNLAFGTKFRVANMLPALVVGGILSSFLPI